jgi:DNA polymerase-3 subunit alpha
VFTIEDAQGGVEVIVFPETYQRSAALIETGTLVLVRGKLERDNESVRVLASEIAPLDSVRERVTREVKIRLKTPANGVVQALLDIVSRHRGDRKVSFEVETAGHLRVRVDVSSQIRVRPSPALVAEVEQVVGLGAVEFR